MARISWTTQAWDELAEVNDALSKYSERFAGFVVSKILESVNRLEGFPRLGRVVPELNVQFIRELVVEKYRIVYYLSPAQEVQILTVRHSSRPLPDTILPFE